MQLYAKAAANAVHRAGFDGVEVHGANEYMIDQFTQSVSNKRTDEYGGSIENRSRFALEVLEAVCKKVGQDRTAFRVSPWGRFGGMSAVYRLCRAIFTSPLFRYARYLGSEASVQLSHPTGS